MGKSSTANSDEMRKFGVLREAMQDDVRKILELMNAQQPMVKLIPKMSERVEKLEHDVALMRLVTTPTNDDMKLIKIRTEQLDAMNEQLHDYQLHLLNLEQAA